MPIFPARHRLLGYRTSSTLTLVHMYTAHILLALPRSILNPQSACEQGVDSINYHQRVIPVL